MGKAGEKLICCDFDVAAQSRAFSFERKENLERNPNQRYVDFLATGVARYLLHG
jgi:hypothetical protein